MLVGYVVIGELGQVYGRRFQTKLLSQMMPDVAAFTARHTWNTVITIKATDTTTEEKHKTHADDLHLHTKLHMILTRS